MGDLVNWLIVIPGHPKSIEVASHLSEAARLTRLWKPDGSEVDLALLMGVECPDNPPVSAFPPWLIALSLAFFRREAHLCKCSSSASIWRVARSWRRR